MLDSKCSEFSVSGREGRHLASLTHSEMIVLNLQQLQNLGVFTYDMVLSECSDTKIYCYSQQNTLDHYLLMVPVAFHHSCKYNAHIFTNLLCLNSLSITVPITGELADTTVDLLSELNIAYHCKTGKNIVKIYLESSCAVTYLDLVTFQAIQFKGKQSQELLLMKKSNAYQFCFNFFKEQLLPSILESQEDSIQAILEKQLKQIKEMFKMLESYERFQVLYELDQETSFTKGQLEKQIQSMVLSRHITTVADQQYDELIDAEMEKIIHKEFNKIQMLQYTPKQCSKLVSGLMKQVLQQLKQYGFQLNEEKYLFIMSNITEKVIDMQHSSSNDLNKQNKELKSLVLMQEREIDSLKGQIKTIKETQQKTKIKLSVIQEEEELLFGQNESTKEKHSVTLADVKQPLQILNSNNTANRDKLSKTMLSDKTKQKIRSNFKGDLQKKTSTKTLSRW